MGNIRWWDVTTGHSSSFNTHREGIRRIKFSPYVPGDHSRGRIAVLFYDNTFSVFDLVRQELTFSGLLVQFSCFISYFPYIFVLMISIFITSINSHLIFHWGLKMKKLNIMSITMFSSFHFLLFDHKSKLIFCRTRQTPWPIHFCNLNFLGPLCWNLIGCPCELIRMIHWYCALLEQMVAFALLKLMCKCHKSL